MPRATLLCAAVALSTACMLRAETLPLQFKTIPAQDVMNFPGGYGLSASLSVSKPSGLHQEPKARSRHPLYGECRLAPDRGGFVLRLDESQGDGTGYDQILVDMNQDGDLTDETPLTRTAQPQGAPGNDWALFGPIPTAASVRVAGERPVLFARTYLNPRAASGYRGAVPHGFVQLKAGWYLETTVTVDGAQRKIGVYDADCNLRVGDLPRSQILGGGGRDANWAFLRGDSWLVDANGSGTFESDPLQSEAVPCGPLLYVGARVFKASLASDSRSLDLEAWTEPLAEVTLTPRGEQVHSVTLAWERQGGQWQLIRPTVVGGKIRVPPGNYRLYNCNLLGRDVSGQQAAVSATERVARMPVSFSAGKANQLACGGPLEVKVSADKTVGAGVVFEALGRSATEGSSTLRISAQLVGAEGEVYSAFWSGDKLNEQPPKPTFSIVDAAGKEVAHGNLEYG